MPARNWKALWLAAVACAVAVPAVTALSGCAARPPASGASAVSTTQRSSDIPPGTQRRLLAIAMRLAKNEKDPDPEWISVVASSHEKAVRASSGDIVYGPDFPVYLITMKGHFIALGTSGPPGSKPPTGEYVTLVVNAKTLQGTDYGITPGPPPEPASALGPVTYLRGP